MSRTGDVPSARTALVFGATGLVGGRLVHHLLGEPDVARVIAPVRRSVSAWDAEPRVSTPLVDFADLESGAEALRADQVFVTLGTTMKKAGSREAFRRVDVDAVVGAAGAALAGGARDAFLVSSLGASPTARTFYLRVKAEAEEAVGALPFRSVHVLRPSILTGDRREARPAERLGILIASALAPLMLGPLRQGRPVAADSVARAMVVLGRDPVPGRHVLESAEIAALGG